MIIKNKMAKHCFPSIQEGLGNGLKSAKIDSDSLVFFGGQTFDNPKSKVQLIISRNKDIGNIQYVDSFFQ